MADICPDCGTPRVDDAKFCEVCRYDFLAPTSVETAPAPAAPVTPTVEPQGEIIRNLWAIVSIDPTLAIGATLEPPRNEPARSYPVDLDEVLVGRKGARPTIHPEVPVQDPAVSARHLKICRRRNGSFYLVDLGSSNGTKLNGVDLMANVEMAIKPGDEILIGQWTKIMLESR